jgi:hypothetical protein
MTPPGRNHLAHQYPRSFKSSMRLASIGAKICWGMPHGEDHMVADRGSRVQYPLTIFAIIAATNAAPAAARIKTPRRLSAFTMCLLKICPPWGPALGPTHEGQSLASAYAVRTVGSKLPNCCGVTLGRKL